MSILATGQVGRGEVGFSEAEEGREGQTYYIPSLSPAVHPPSDLRALVELSKLIRGYRPDIVHTHTAKAGFVGRLAALLGRDRPVLLHTFHGHVLKGYFGPVASRVYRNAERILARPTDCLIGVSRATVRDLVAAGVAPQSKFRVIPLGLDLDAFLGVAGRDERLRAELNVASGDVMALYVGRLAPIKRLDVALRAVARARALGAPFHFVLAGDGSVRARLESQARELGIAGHVTFLGYRRDVAKLLGATDIALLSSDSEGTPVFLIEAAAAGRPVVATAVGGVPEVVRPDFGMLVSPGDLNALASALVRLAGDADMRVQMGMAGRENVPDRYRSERLVRDIEGLYGELLHRRSRETLAARTA